MRWHKTQETAEGSVLTFTKANAWNFPSTTSSSCSRRVQLLGRFGARRTQYWLTFPGGGSSVQQSHGGQGTKTKLPNGHIRCILTCIDKTTTTSTRNIFSPLKITIHSWRPGRAGKKVGGKIAWARSVSSAQSGATAPTILEAGNIISQDMLGLYFKKGGEQKKSYKPNRKLLGTLT